MYDKDLEYITNMLDMLEEGMKDMYYKEYQKLWRCDLTLPLSLKDALETLNKDELTKIRQNLNLKGLSTLNKTDLIDKLVSRIPSSLEEVFNKFDDYRYKVLKSIIANGDYIVVDSDNFKKLNYFRYYGIAITGWKGDDTILTVPSDVIEAFSKHDTLEYRAIVKKNTMWINLTKGMLFYYGLLDFNYTIEQLEHYTQEKCDFVDVFPILYDASQYHFEMDYASMGFKDSRVLDGYTLKEEQSIIKDIPYHLFTKKEILRASQIDYIDKTAQTNEFTKYFKHHYYIDNHEIDVLLNLIYLMINNGNGMNDMLEMIQEQFEIESIEEFQYIASLLMNIHNNTRQWILKGNTPSELNEMREPLEKSESKVIDFKTRRKIGRNDPCPCGSGIKYKRCCGKP